ncbi:hypothetical protein Fmac_003886 [Flemingia macrophylla]|uniref:30S ribosomal protein S8, chloroplastic n=1 Tax=Flemingia macrophylla TaxID=520843 RepID=A0ABD1N3Z4_9FABA
MGRRILNDALRTIVNAERRGKATVDLKPISTVMSSFLRIMKHHGEYVLTSEYGFLANVGVTRHKLLIGYIRDFQVYDPHRVGRITVELQGRINDCKALTFRKDIKARDIEAYRLKTLPTHQWGYVVITTPDGVLDHEEAIKKNVGGQVLGYFH